MTPHPNSADARSRSKWWSAAAAGAVALFFLIFFQLTLPNDGRGLSRTDVWLDLPDILYFNVITHSEAGNVGWRNFPQRVPLIAVGLWILCGAWGTGCLLLRVISRACDRTKPATDIEPTSETFTRLERFVFALGVGLAAVSLLMLACGLAAQRVPSLMSRPVLGALISLPIAIEAVAHWMSRSQTLRTTTSDARIKTVLAGRQIPFESLARGLVIVVVSLFVMAMALGALLPSIDFDVKEYHLGGPKEWFQTGSVHFLPHNVYTSFPFLTEMLLLLGMVLTGDWFWGASAGQLVLASFGLLTGLGVFAAARRWFGERAAWAALLIHLSSPWTYRISVIAYAEGGLTFYLFAAFFAVALAIESRQRSRLLLAGLLAGSGMACKYPGLVSVVLPLGAGVLVSAWRDALPTDDFKTRSREVLSRGGIYSLGVVLAVGPWLLKNFCETGNPVYPLLNSVFHGIDWNADLEAHWKHAHSPPHHDPSDILVKLFDVTMKSDWLSPLLFGLAPFALIVARRARAGSTPHEQRLGVLLYWTAAFVAFQFATWWLLTHRIDRFWVPLIPLVSLLAGVGVWWSRERIWTATATTFISLSVLFNIGFITLPNCGLNAYLNDLDEVAEQTQETASGIAALNRLKLPSNAKVLLVGEAQIFDARFSLLYNTVFDVSIFEQWCSANVPELPAQQQPFKPIGDIKQKLAEEGITHVFVNWQEILRYRTTGYGGSDFVEPRRFQALCEARVLTLKHPAFTGIRPTSSFRSYELDEIKSWAPSLIVQTAQGEGFIVGQLFEVPK